MADDECTLDTDDDKIADYKVSKSFIIYYHWGIIIFSIYVYFYILLLYIYIYKYNQVLHSASYKFIHGCK